MTSCQLLADPDLEPVLLAPYRKKSRLRALTLTPFYPSAEDPTQGTFVSEPLAYLQSEGISNRTIAVQPLYRRHAHSLPSAPSDNIHYFCLPSHVGLPTSGQFLSKRLLRSILEEHRRDPFDLIHAHAALPCGHAALLLGKRLGIPFVVSVHGLDAFFVRQAGTLVGAWCKRISRDVYRFAAAVICISEKVREQVLREVSANTVVVYNGVDAVTFSPGQKTDSLLSVLSVGNLIPTKGHADLLRAFATVSKIIPCTLEIVGDGPESRNLNKLAGNLGIGDKVKFRGRQSKDAVAEAMRRSTVFALPSVYEGLGCVYLEAMACAKPVIACKGQGIEEVIQDGKTGLLVPTASNAELTEALAVLLGDPVLCRKMGTAARELVVEGFTVQHQAKQLAMIYERCSR